MVRVSFAPLFQSCEVAFERGDALADLALLDLGALHAGERLAAPLADEIDDRDPATWRPGIGARLLARRAQAREELVHHLRGLRLAVELGLPVLERLDLFFELPRAGSSSARRTKTMN